MKSGWRSLTAQEAATWPKAKLGGALAVMCVAAGLLTLLLLALGLMGLLNADEAGSMFAWPGQLDTARDAEQARAVLGLVSLTSWAAAAAGFLILTLLRADATPTLTAAGLIVLFILGEGLSLYGQYLMLASYGGESFFPYLFQSPELWLRWIAYAIVISAAVAYLLGGVRPNAYFRRRVAVTGSETE